MQQGRHPNSLKNLRPFNTMSDAERKAMNSRGGQNKKKNADERKNCAEVLKLIVEKIYTDKKTGSKADGREALMVRLFKKAMDGDVPALKLILLLLGEMPTPELKINSNEPSDNGILEGLLKANLKIQKQVMRGKDEKTRTECPDENC